MIPENRRLTQIDALPQFQQHGAVSQGLTFPGRAPSSSISN